MHPEGKHTWIAYRGTVRCLFINNDVVSRKTNFTEKHTSKYVVIGTNSIGYCVVQCLMTQGSGCLTSYDLTVFSAGCKKMRLAFLDPGKRHPQVSCYNGQSKGNLRLCIVIISLKWTAGALFPLLNGNRTKCHAAGVCRSWSDSQEHTTDGEEMVRGTKHP